MKSTAWIKKELQSTQQMIEKIEKEMLEKNISHENAGNIYKYPPKPEIHYTGTTYKEALASLITEQRVLKTILQP